MKADRTPAGHTFALSGVFPLRRDKSCPARAGFSAGGQVIASKSATALILERF
jgi:hypothetical protein